MLHCINAMRCISSAIKYIYVYRHSYTGANPEFFFKRGAGREGRGLWKLSKNFMFFRAIIMFSLSKKYTIYITLYNQSIFRCTFYIYRYTCTYYIHGISHAHYACIVCVNTFTLYVRYSWPLKGRGCLRCYSIYIV